MNHKRISILTTISILALIVLLSACMPGKVESPLPTNTIVPPSATPTSTQVPPSPTPAPHPFPGLIEWDLLILSDSSNWGVGEHYARLIEADMKVKVTLHDCWVGNLRILDPLKILQSGATWGTWSSDVGDQSCLKPLTALVKEAEVMVLEGNPMGSASPAGFDACMSGRYEGKYKLPGFDTYKETVLASCSPENWATYKTNLGLLIDEIFKVREGRPIVLRMTDLYIPVHPLWAQEGVDEVCTACIGSFSDAIRQVAEEHGVPVADTIVGFNGKDYMSDPVDEGYISPDGEHPSNAGTLFIATLLQQTGYGYSGK